MMNTKFEAYKLKRELKRSGINYTFMRKGTNEFGEPSGSPLPVGTVCGLYHEQNSNIQITTGETTQTRTKKIPTILCLFDDLQPLGLRVGDYVEVHGKVFKVTGVVDIQEWQIIADISLEVVDDATEG